jgi:hypothetical protein
MVQDYLPDPQTARVERRSAIGVVESILFRSEVS